MKLHRINRWAVAFVTLALLAPPHAAAARLKDVAGVEGVRDNQLIGYGLVVGLAGTGDRRQSGQPWPTQNPESWHGLSA